MGRDSSVWEGKEVPTCNDIKKTLRQCAGAFFYVFKQGLVISR